LAEEVLLQGKTIAIDGTTLEASAALRSDGTSVQIWRDYTNRLIKEVVRNHRWTKKYVDGLGRTVKEETGYGGVLRPDGKTKPEVTETVVDTQYCGLPQTERDGPGSGVARSMFPARARRSER
jgi:hypothetical protein